MRLSDLPAAVALCRAAGWNQTERSGDCFWSGRQGKPLQQSGTAGRSARRSCGRTAPHVAWVAMVLVDPAERGRGVGRALLDHAIGLAGEGQALRLDATPAGRLLYSDDGFSR